MFALPLISWCSVRKPESLVSCDVLVGIVGLFNKSLYEPDVATVAKSDMFALPLISWCSVKNPLSFVSCDVLVGIVGLSVKSL